MARRVFISFLGTNNYLQTHYELNGVCSSAVRFVQQALIEFLCKKWTEKDCVMIFYTGGPSGSYVKNWLDNGQTFFNENAEVEKNGLYSSLKSMNFPMIIEGHEIVEGFSEEDIWSIFDCVYDKLQDEDEIYFDVTHAFRSIPLFSTVLFNYTRFMKQTKLVSIHYGAFEKLGPAREVSQLPLEQRIAPIINLTSLVDLQNTNVAASNFIEFGKVGTIASQLDTTFSPVTKSQRKSYEAIKFLKSELAKLDGYILTCRMSDIRKGKYIKIIFEQFDNALKTTYLLSSEKLLLMRIKANLKAFKPYETDENIAAAVEWACRYGMVQQAYTLGQEFVITQTCNLLQDRSPFERSKYGQKKFRFYIAGVLGISENMSYKDELAEFSDLTDELLSLQWMQVLRKEYNVLRINRNILNHAKDCKKQVEELIYDFEMSYNECIRVLKNELENNVY